MRCIFPCLQLIYFYMGVDYMHCVFLFFFPLLWESRLERLVLHCLRPAETDRHRQSTDGFTKTDGFSVQQDKTHFLRERVHPV